MEQSDATKEQKNATRGKPKYRNQFIIKLFKLLESKQYPNALSWSTDGSRFQIVDYTVIENTVLAEHFNHSKYPSFIRQKVTGESAGRREYYHEDFKSGRPDLLPRIKRTNRLEAKKSSKLPLRQEIPKSEFQIDEISSKPSRIYCEEQEKFIQQELHKAYQAIDILKRENQELKWLIDHCDYQVPSNQRSLLSKLSSNPTLSKAAGLNDYAFHQQNLAQTSNARMTYRSVPKELFAQNEFELAALQDFQVPYFQPYKVQRKEFGTYNLAPIEFQHNMDGDDTPSRESIEKSNEELEAFFDF